MTAKLDQFQEKRSVWKEWLVGDEEHSIQKQLDNLIFDHAVYKSIRVASSNQSEKTSPPVPPIIGWYLDKSYAANQLIGIRRLCDKNDRNDSITIKGLDTVS